jgi:hypothetical protein
LIAFGEARFAAALFGTAAFLGATDFFFAGAFDDFENLPFFVTLTFLLF